MSEESRLRKAVACKCGVNVTLPDWAYVAGPALACPACPTRYELLVDRAANGEEGQSHRAHFAAQIAAEHPHHETELFHGGDPRLYTARRGDSAKRGR